MLDRLATVSSGSIKGRNLPRWVRGGLAVVLLVWLAWALADTAWLLISGPSRLVPPDESLLRLERAGAGAGSDGPTLTASRIDQWELFGPAEDTVPVSVANAPETRLRLELVGVFQHPSDELASAIIAEKGKDSELYHIGDRLPGNAILEQVLADRVILLRAGQRETLRMKEEQLGEGEVARIAPPVEEQRAPPPVSLLGDDKKDLMAKRARAMRDLRLEPSPIGGYVVGSPPPHVLDQTGLREGDVIISINGFDVGTVETDVAAIESVIETKTVSGVIMRDGQMITINWPP